MVTDNVGARDGPAEALGWALELDAPLGASLADGKGSPVGSALVEADLLVAAELAPVDDANAVAEPLAVDVAAGVACADAESEPEPRWPDADGLGVAESDPEPRRPDTDAADVAEKPAL